MPTLDRDEVEAEEKKLVAILGCVVVFTLIVLPVVALGVYRCLF